MIPRIKKATFSIKRVWKPEERMELAGQKARTLYALVKNKKTGISSLEISSWALRLSGYIHQLRGKGFTIETRDEKHDGGIHGRYFLKDAVKIVKVEWYAHSR